MPSIRRYLKVIQRLRTLNLSDAWLLLRIAGLRMALPFLQRVHSLPDLMRFLDTNPVPAPDPRTDPQRLIHLTQGLLRQNVGIFRDNCLTQSLLLFRFLRRNGYPAMIHFGISKQGNKLAGHSWLELEGEPLAEKEDPTQAFKAIYSFPTCDA